MMVIPAIDIKSGRCVRLLQGRMEDETVYADDPSEVARRWESEGAALIHVVDLDGAVEKRPVNLEAIEQILKSVSVPIQLGGGLRDMETIEGYLATGIERVVIGTEAVRNPQLVETACRRFPGKIVVGIDARDGYVAVEGWTETTRTTAVELAKRFEGCGVAGINFTDISRDGMQTGPNILETQRLAESVSIPVYASGGVSTLEDIRRLLPLTAFGLAGVITGKALYSGSLELGDALRLVGRWTGDDTSSTP
ncbi:MAG: 1-(5-phosphoribosyl)-5-[(5-phosphoribosylamino)methylideneamino]imidazole-4-carboxamide isomerase [Desulfobacterales bacterium]